MGVYTHHKYAKDFKDPVILTFRKRIYKDDNDVFLIIAGARGSGKSGSGISMGYQIDINKRGHSRFYLDKKYIPSKLKIKEGEIVPRVVYKPSHFMDMLKNHDKYPRGTCVLWDEAGVEGDARDFATKKNKLLKKTFQTVRSLGWFLILTAVTRKDFDVGIGRNAGFYMRMFGRTNLKKHAGYDYPCAVSKVYEIVVNPTTGKDITPFIKYNFRGDGNFQKRLSEPYYIRKPPLWLEAPYKRMKTLFQTELYSEYASELDDIDNFALDENTKTGIDIVNDKILEIKNNPLDYFDVKTKKFMLGAVQYVGDIKIKNNDQARKILQIVNIEYRKGGLNVGKN